LDYACSDNQLTLHFATNSPSAENPTITTVEGVGTPASFYLPALAYQVTDINGIESTSSYDITSDPDKAESLKNSLLEGEHITLMKYNINYAQQ
jgi:hypothetical protein